MRRISLTAMLLASTVLPNAASAQTDAAEQQPPPQTRQDGGRRANQDDEEDIVVTGQRLPGSVIGDVQPELMLNPGDVRALGVSDITELVAELGPQLTSGRGGQPLVLLDGRRVSSFREIATIPTEAIARVEILPEEVAIKYGYAPDQKVMNIVLRRRFRAFTLEGQNRLTTDGGANHSEGELGFLTLRRGTRLNLNVEYDRDAALLESQRNILTTTGTDTQRTLQASTRQFTVTGTYARPLSQTINASINAEASTTQNASLVGPPLAANATVPANVIIPDYSALDRSVSAQNVRLGSTINRDGTIWRGTLTTSYTHDESRTITERGYDLANSSGTVAAPGLAVVRPADVARSRADVATADLTANGNLYRLPAGELSLTARIGGTINRFESETTRSLVTTPASFSRSIGLGSLSLDAPLIKSPSPFIGKLSANGNVEVQTLSDFGTLVAYGGGLNWRPRSGVAFIASYRGSQTAPTVQQLGNPTIVTSNVQVFDYQAGKTVNITQISGGNRALREADQKDIRLGLTLKPWSKPDVTLTLDYNHRTTTNAIGALPGTTDAAEAAFGSRFVRDPLVCADPSETLPTCVRQLVSIDTRSINIARRENSSFRWGLNFTKTLKTPQSQIDAMRASFQQRFPNGFPGQGGPGGPGGEGGPRPEGGGQGGNGQGGQNGGGVAGAGGFSGAPGGGPGGGGGFGGGGFGGGPGGGGRGGGGGGRINIAVYHTIHLTDTVRLADGLPLVDLLNGGTLGERAGQPRHEVELQAGVSQAGMGMRLTGKWESATRVTGTGIATSDLRFSDIATFNLRLFANLGQLPGLIGKPLWRGARLQLGVNNILNTRQKVTDGTGATPLAYRPGLVDPLGRTVTITLRKQLF